MSLRELAAKDGAAILADEVPVVLTSPDTVPVTHNVHAIVSAVGVHPSLDGVIVEGDRCAVTISTVELAEAGLADPYSLKSGTWGIETTDVNGAAISGTLGTVLVDATLARVTVYVKEDD